MTDPRITSLCPCCQKETERVLAVNPEEVIVECADCGTDVTKSLVGKPSQRKHAAMIESTIAVWNKCGIKRRTRKGAGK